ncbi:MAG: Jag N-terminal domain-containing protein [Caldimicrobium sp.]|nr:Jag N-terminal domain-containing protein [Caldimicrobium sp.]MCX7873340.1 Jag N-terminal domain-containing protein [Caldimicrobium sp.]MDW8093422.1 Jag N-terminal domain-containing protein [Caldimicrobium sp.]
MEKILELEGKSLDQLVEKACQDLGCLPPDLDIEIKEFEAGGMLGSGRKIKAVFKIKPEKLLSERANRALTFLKELCFYSDFNLETQTQILKDQREIVIILSGEDTKYLLQNGGEVLSAVEFLVNKVVAKALGVGPKITLKIKGIDIERERKLAQAVRKALELIKKDQKERTIKIGNKREERLVLNIIKEEGDFEAEVVEDQKGKRVILRVKNP